MMKDQTRVVLLIFSFAFHKSCDVQTGFLVVFCFWRLGCRTTVLLIMLVQVILSCAFPVGDICAVGFIPEGPGTTCFSLGWSG